MKRRIVQFLFGGPGAATALGDFGLAVARIGLGLLMAFGHGLGKIWADGSLGPADRFVEGVGKLGFPAPTFFAWCAALTEFVAALLLAAGLVTRPAAMLLCGNMLVAAFLQHGKDPIFNPGGPNKEFALLYLLPFFMFLTTGGGRYSIDRFLRKDRRGSPKSH